jgi:hypothetical protein
MKKSLFVFVIIIIAASGLIFTACNNATPQGQLGDYFTNYEKYVYQAVDKTDENAPVTGTYVMSAEKFSGGQNVTLAEGFVLNAVGAGVLVEGNLTIADTTITTKCYFLITSNNNFLVPLASYRNEIKGGVETQTKINYSQGSCTYEYILDGQKTEGSLSFNSPCYDTNEIYNTLRGASTMGVGFSMTFSVPLAAENEVASLTASCGANERVSSPAESADELYGEGIDCYVVTLSRSTKVAGINYTLYYSTSQITVNNWQLTRPLIKIVENKVEYNLLSVSTVKTA